MNDPLVTTHWLSDRLGDPDLQVIDATWYMPGEAGSGIADHEAAHVPGAVFFDIDAIADHETDLPHMLPSPVAFAEAAGRLGLRRDATIVVYDARGLFSAARVWWTLKVMDFADVFVLDGGLPKWRSEGRAVEPGMVRPTPSNLSPAFNPTLVRDIEAVRKHLVRGDAQLLDARGAARFRGEAPEPRAGVRGGHMPGAHNLPFAAVLNKDGTMKAAAELQSEFEQSGVALSGPIVTTCGSGVTAAILSLALARLGVGESALYDGSWTEWGALAHTPVVTGL